MTYIIFNHLTQGIGTFPIGTILLVLLVVGGKLIVSMVLAVIASDRLDGLLMMMMMKMMPSFSSLMSIEHNTGHLIQSMTNRRITRQKFTP
jgi:hypothetical protein